MNISYKSNEEDYFVKCGKSGSPLADCVVVDSHVHIGPMSGFPILDSSVEKLISEMDRIGIDQAYVSGLPAVTGPADRMGNDIVLDAITRYPDRIRGYMALNISEAEKIIVEMQRCYDAGIRAVKIFGGLGYDHPTYQIIYGFADEHDLPVLAHTWGDELDQLAQPFEKYTRVRWLLAHTGSKDLPKYIRMAMEFENVYLETCFSVCPRGLFEKLVREVPLHKIIWGSDQLFVSATHQLGRVVFAHITPQQKQAILGGNAVTFFGKD